MAQSVPLILGIDVGTTSVKVALVNSVTGEVLESKSRDPSAHVATQESCWSVQDVARFLSSLHQLVSSLSTKERLACVRHIAICGQMHGLVLWPSGEGWARSQFGRMDARACSNLVTWQDRRCDRDFLSGLPKPSPGARIATGYGCATLFWLAKNDPLTLEQYDCAGTLADFIVASLANLDRPVMSVQMAASWGFFDCRTSKWDMESLSKSGFPVHLLPKVVPPGHVVGELPASWESIPAGAKVYVSLGDLQCSVYSCLKQEGCAALNLSTSGQLAFRLKSEQDLDTHACLPSSVELVPYFAGPEDKIAVAASLNGGNVLARFVKMVQVWVYDLGISVPPENQVWTRLGEVASHAPDTDMQIHATLFGERHCPEQRASAENLRTQNLQLGSVYKSLCRGVIRNLAEMMPVQILHEWNITKIIGSGSALTRNPILQACLHQEFSGFEIDVVAGKGACYGVANFVRDTITPP